LLVKGVSQDNGDIISITVNGRLAELKSSHAGVADWEIMLDAPRDQKLSAHASDKAGNTERTGHQMVIDLP